MLKPLLSLLLTATSTLSHPLLSPRQQQIITTPNAAGTHDGYYFTHWTDGGAPLNYQNLPGGSYKMTWGTGGQLSGGKGWSGAGQGHENRTISFKAELESQGNTYVGVYGWTKNPMVEFYVIEYHGTYNPLRYEVLGNIRASQNFTSATDGGLYDVGRDFHVTMALGQPSWHIMYSVRREKRLSGKVDMNEHFEQWRRTGVTLGELEYMVVAVDAYYSNGTATVTILPEEKGKGKGKKAKGGE